MDQHLFELVLLRATERLIAVLLGGVAIVLGYRLFMNVPQATESSAEVDLPGRIKIILTRIGPGVFFALFGAGIIWASYHYQVTMSSKEIREIAAQLDSIKRDTVQHTVREMSYSGANGDIDTDEQAQESQRAEVRRAIRTLNQTLTKATAQEQVSLSPAIETGKFALICLIWQKDWGKPGEFKAWLNERGTMPASFQEPFALYKLTGL